MEKKSSGAAVIAIAVITLLIGAGAGYWYGGKMGYQKGYAKAEADVKKVQEEAGKKAVEEAAKAANPFNVANPLEQVEANPFDKLKKALNPFE